MESEILTELSPKFTTMESGARMSRFGRPQKEAKQDVNSIPTEVAKFISKHSPKQKPKKSAGVFINQKENDHDESSNVYGALFGGSFKSEAEDITQTPVESEDAKNENNNLVLNDDEQKSSEEQNEMECEESEAPVDGVKESTEVQLKEEIIADTIDLKEEIIADTSSDDAIAKDSSDDGIVTEDKSEDEIVTANKSNDEVVSDNRSDDESCEKEKPDFSDTDSALGSAVSLNDIKPNKGDGDFFAGQILWGSFGKASWFPVMVYPYDDEGSITGKSLAAFTNNEC